MQSWKVALDDTDSGFRVWVTVDAPDAWMAKVRAWAILPDYRPGTVMPVSEWTDPRTEYVGFPFDPLWERYLAGDR